MLFNNGFKCESCGPIAKAKSKTISKIKRNVCPNCEKIVTEWTRPLTERVGRCSNCGKAAFLLSVNENRDLVRTCKNCKTVLNTDTKEITGEGDKIG